MKSLSKHLKYHVLWYYMKASLVAQLAKNLAMQETLAQFLGWEDQLEKG